MKKFLMLTLLVSFIACVTSDTALAQKKKRKKRDLEKIFKRLDKDKDEKLSFDEFKGKREGKKLERAKKQFKRLDKDKDGFLTLKEFKTRKKKRKRKNNANAKSPESLRFRGFFYIEIHGFSICRLKYHSI